MEFLREDEEIDSWDSATTVFPTTTETSAVLKTTTLPETTTTNMFVMFDSDLKVFNQTDMNNSSSIQTNQTPFITNNWIYDVLRSIQELPIWSQIMRYIQNTFEFVTNTIADLDPIALCLIVLAIFIAIGGLFAIFCQCCLWRRAKRKHQQRTFDTTSWFEYAFDREKFAHLDHNGNEITQDNFEQQKKENLENYYNDMSSSMVEQRSKNNIINESFKSQSEFSAIDIENCQLAQSFMRHNSDSKGSKKVLLKKSNKSSLSRVEKKKMLKKKKDRENEGKSLNGCVTMLRPNRYFVPYGTNMFYHQSMPILHPSTILSSVSPKKKNHAKDEHNDLLLRSCSSSTASMPRMKVNQTNYEIQTCALNLSYDSADTDLSTDPMIEVDNSTVKSVKNIPSKTSMFGSNYVENSSTPQYSTKQTNSTTIRKATIDRAVKSRQQVPSKCSQTQTRSFTTKHSSMTAITGTSLSSKASSTEINEHFPSTSAISKNPLYREFSTEKKKRTQNNNSFVEADLSLVSGVTISSCSTFTRPPKQKSVNKL